MMQRSCEAKDKASGRRPIDVPCDGIKRRTPGTFSDGRLHAAAHACIALSAMPNAMRSAQIFPQHQDDPTIDDQVEPAFTEECIICMEDFVTDAITTTSCGHTICEACLGKYALAKAMLPPQGPLACPMCRQPMPPAEVPKTADLVIEKPTKDAKVGIVFIKDYDVRDSSPPCVERVRPDSLAERAGLRKGHPVIKINGKSVSGAREGATILGTAEGTVTLTIDLLKVAENSWMRHQQRAALAAQQNTQNEFQSRHLRQFNHWAPVTAGGINEYGSLPLLSDDGHLNAVSCCCWCVVLGQLAQYALCKRAKYACVIVAAIFFVLSFICVGTEAAQAVLDISGVYGNSTQSSTAAALQQHSSSTALQQHSSTAALPHPTHTHSSLPPHTGTFIWTDWYRLALHAISGVDLELDDHTKGASVGLALDVTGFVTFWVCWVAACALIHHIRNTLMRDADSADMEWRYGGCSCLHVCCTASRLLKRLNLSNYRLCAVLPDGEDEGNEGEGGAGDGGGEEGSGGSTENNDDNANNSQEAERMEQGRPPTGIEMHVPI